jgi:ComF family protein
MEALFADMMTDFAEKYMTISDFDRIISVPLHRAKLRERTFNQAEMLALPLSRKFRIPYIGNNLVRIKPGRSQTSLSKSGRVKDIEGAFRVRNAAALKDKSVLLVDDVFTTGATVNECSMALKKAGAKYVGVLTLARGI